MGRTVQRERKKQANHGPAAAGVQSVKPSKNAGSKHKANNPSGSLVPSVSAAFAEKNWTEVVARLEAMRRAGETPKLGTSQRWVRLADLCGDPRVAASVLACVLRCIPGSGGPMGSLPAGKKTKGGKAADPVRRHPPWSPPLSAQQQAWLSNAASSEASAPLPSPDYQACLSLVPQDGTTQPAKRPSNWSELKIWQCTPNTVRFTEPQPKVVRVDVPFVPGAFVLTGLLSPCECRQLVAATEACGYRWDVDYTFNPSNPDSAATDAPETQEPSDAVQPQPILELLPESVDRLQPAPADQQGGVSEPQPASTTDPNQPILQAPVDGPGSGMQAEPLDGAQGASLGLSTAAQPHDRAQGAPGAEVACGSYGRRRPAAGHDLHPLLSAARTTAGGDRAAGCVWLADESLLGPITRRAAPHLQQKCAGKALAGINARWRFYRYDAGNVYRPHIDGAWPGSGLKDGKLCHDAFGDRWSHYTFLIYLNDDFEGGSTTFFTPAADDRMALDARGVQPRAGNVLVFPHGDNAASLVHEGSAVTSGAKYVIRTDVLYFT